MVNQRLLKKVNLPPSAAKESKTAAEKIYPAAPHAETKAEKRKELEEESYPAGTEDRKVPHAK
ncbi:hypothetical protein SAMN05421755_104012 [Nitrosomonas sp. Nm33]|nr:hypothetical protein SAMN05421755_104012 [Nitrosomonas sp. Nm33]